MFARQRKVSLGMFAAFVAVCAGSAFLSTTAPAKAQSVDDCQQLVSQERWDEAAEACAELTITIGRIRQSQAGSYGDGAEHSLAEIPDQLSQVNMQVADSFGYEMQAVIATHFGRLTSAQYFIGIAKSESEAAATFNTSYSARVRHSASVAKVLFQRQTAESAFIDHRIALVTGRSEKHAIRPTPVLVMARKPIGVASRKPIRIVSRKATRLSSSSLNGDASIRGTAVEPDYPDIARQQGVTGTAQIKVTLDANGNVTDVSVYKSSGNAALDDSALKAAKATEYEAETVNGVKTPGSYLFRADFTGE